MAAPKRNKTQRERDLELLARRYCEGVTQVDIAKEIGVSRQQINYDLKVIQQRWLESSLVNFDEAKSRELAKIDNLEREAWEAWYRSCQDKEVLVEKVSGTLDEKKAERMTRKEGQAGDARFLATVQWCINKRCEILGLDAPTKLDINWQREFEQAGINPADMFERMVNAAMEETNERE